MLDRRLLHGEIKVLGVATRLSAHSSFGTIVQETKGRVFSKVDEFSILIIEKHVEPTRGNVNVKATLNVHTRTNYNTPVHVEVAVDHVVSITTPQLPRGCIRKFTVFRAHVLKLIKSIVGRNTPILSINVGSEEKGRRHAPVRLARVTGWTVGVVVALKKVGGHGGRGRERGRVIYTAIVVANPTLRTVCIRAAVDIGATGGAHTLVPIVANVRAATVGSVAAFHIAHTCSTAMFQVIVNEARISFFTNLCAKRIGSIGPTTRLLDAIGCIVDANHVVRATTVRKSIVCGWFITTTHLDTRSSMNLSGRIDRKTLKGIQFGVNLANPVEKKQLVVRNAAKVAEVKANVGASGCTVFRSDAPVLSIRLSHVRHEKGVRPIYQEIAMALCWNGTKTTVSMHVGNLRSQADGYK